MNIRIRRAVPGDCAALARIQVDSYSSAYAGILPPAYLQHFTYQEQEQDWLDWFSSGSRNILHVAVIEDGEVVGYAYGRPNPGEIVPYDSELVSLHVRRQHQRLNLGRRLMASVSRDLASQGCASLFLWVLEGNPARAFYEKLGGVLLTQKPWENNAEFSVTVHEVACGWPDIRQLFDK
jgi:ribosomal protein S18 acetylase RimI-like enzyme